MRHNEFKIGMEFYNGAGKWRCTDIGRRTIIAIKLDHDSDPSWYNGPPYAIVEHVLDAYALEGCEAESYNL